MSEKLQLDEFAYSVWEKLADGKAVEVNELAAALKSDQSKVLVAAQEAQAVEAMAISEENFEELIPTAEAIDLVTNGLPERQALSLLTSADGEMATGDFAKAAGQAKIAVNDVFRWGKTRGWIDRDKQGVRITNSGKQAAEGEQDVDEKALLVANGETVKLSELEDSKRVKNLLGKRGELAKIK
ncbi:MAG: hypothetical protein HON04_14210, partial [Planctomicrobium sp.]|nr:hypothetical protein [Planctomicrobium sp.]